MVIAEPEWLHTAAQIAGVILTIELGLVLIVVCALMIALAVGARWLHTHVTPVLQEYAPRAQQAMTIAQQGSDRVVGGVAEFYGRRQQVRTSISVLLFGRRAAERVREEGRIRASEELQLITASAADLPAMGEEATPHVNVFDAALNGHADHNGHQPRPADERPDTGPDDLRARDAH